ncbi:MAG: urease accessory protein UreD [Roseiarcus sp.]|jgi:urease accessory protein
MDPLSSRPFEKAPAAGRQRALGEVRAAFARAGARTEAARVFETGGLRLRFPRAGDECEAVLINTGGGMAGGDRARIVLAAGPGARVFATTQAAEKIYRADGAPCRIETRFCVEAGGALCWAPQETLLFDGARLERRLEADVAADGSLLLIEAAVFGRLAHGETRIEAHFLDRWRVRRAGRLIFAEALRLENAAADLDRPAVGRGARAIAALVYAAPEAPDRLSDLREALAAVAAEPDGELDAGASAFDGLLVARAASRAPQRLRAAVETMLRVLRGRGTPRVWT